LQVFNDLEYNLFLWKPSGFHRVLPPSFWFGYQYGRDNTLFQFPQSTLYDLTIEDLDIEIHLIKEGEVLSKDSKSHAKFVHGIKVLLAKNYIDNLSEEARKGMTEKAEQGLYPSYAPIGYKNNLETRQIEVDLSALPYIRKLFEWYASGNYSLSQVAKKIGELGLRSRSGKQIPKSSIERILKNPIYYGDFTWNGRLYKGKHQPIVSRELWDQVQEAFRKTNRPQQTRRNFPFTGMLKCAFCGCTITAELKKGKYIYYHCTGSKGSCPKPHVRQEVLEKKLGEVIKGIHISDEIKDWIIKALRESHKEEKSYHDRIIKGLQSEYNQIQDRIDKAYEDKLDGKIPEDLFLRSMNRWRKEQDRILYQINQYKGANRFYLDEGVKILELANKAYLLYKKQDAYQKARLLKTVQSNCLWDGVSTRPEYRKPFDILAKGLQTGNWLS
jgi:site-specific DNA recombinase